MGNREKPQCKTSLNKEVGLTSQHKREIEMRTRKNTRQSSGYWMTPLIAGGCLAIGYSITHRVVIIKNNRPPIGTETFMERKAFPKVSLGAIKMDDELIHSNAKTNFESKTKAKLKPNKVSQDEKQLSRFDPNQQKQTQAALDALNPVQNQSQDLLEESSDRALTQSNQNESTPEKNHLNIQKAVLNSVIESLPEP